MVSIDGLEKKFGYPFVYVGLILLHQHIQMENWSSSPAFKCVSIPQSSIPRSEIQSSRLDLFHKPHRVWIFQQTRNQISTSQLQKIQTHAPYAISIPQAKKKTFNIYNFPLKEPTTQNLCMGIESMPLIIIPAFIAVASPLTNSGYFRYQNTQNFPTRPRRAVKVSGSLWRRRGKFRKKLRTKY